MVVNQVKRFGWEHCRDSEVKSQQWEGAGLHWGLQVGVPTCRVGTCRVSGYRVTGGGGHEAGEQAGF